MGEEQEYDPDEVLADFDDDELFTHAADELEEEEEEETAELDFDRIHASHDVLDLGCDDREEEAA
jgi:hypothetical protein